MSSIEMKIGNHIVNSLKDKIREPITLGNIMYIAKDLMTMVEEYRGLNGGQKKKFVIDAISSLIYEHGGEHKNQLITIAQFVLPEAIDIIISATKGLLSINNIKQIDDACCRCY